MRLLSLLIITIVVWAYNVNGYSTGAPRSSCGSMMPSHGRSASYRRSGQPFYITVSGDGTYEAGQTLQVTIKGINKEFKGFLLQARSVNGSMIGGNSSYGTFVARRYRTKFVCSRSFITHENARKRGEETIEWKAPAPPVGDLIFVATVVESYRSVWLNVTSPPLRDQERLRKENVKNMSVSLPVNSTLEACKEDELLPLRYHPMPQVTILCNAHTQCPCTWKCCPICEGDICTKHAICRQPAGNTTATHMQ